jgi:hypothetical protein
MVDRSRVPTEAWVYIDDDTPSFGEAFLLDECPVCMRGAPQVRDGGIVCGCGAVFDSAVVGEYSDHVEPWARDVLVYADRDAVAHKHVDELGRSRAAYWTVPAAPRNTCVGWRILFYDGDCVHSVGEMSRFDSRSGESDRIWFEPLRDYDGPPIDVDPPTRGYTYIEPLERRAHEQSQIDDFSRTSAGDSP